MKWVKHNYINISDTVSSLSFGPPGTVACSSWDGSVTIASQAETVAQVQFSRPVFAVAWQPHKAKLLVCGGENRVSEINLEQRLCTDVLEGSCSHLLDVKPINESVFTAVSRRALQLCDTRAIDAGISTPRGGGTCIDVEGTQLVVIGAYSARVFDYRQMTDWVSEYKLGQGPIPLRAVWLNKNQYAVSDSASQISVVDTLNSSDSYVFKSNRCGDKPRPVYSLARGTQTSSIACGGGDCSVYVWDFEKRSLISKAAFPLACTALACTPRGDFAVGLSTDQWLNTHNKFNEASKSKVMVAVA